MVGNGAYQVLKRAPRGSPNYQVRSNSRFYYLVPNTRQPLLLSAGARQWYGRRCKPASFPGRTEVRLPGNYEAGISFVSSLFSLCHREADTFFPRGFLSNEYSLTHWLVARAALTLVFSTRLLSRSFFSSPVLPTYLDHSYVFTLLTSYTISLPSANRFQIFSLPQREPLVQNDSSKLL